METKAEKGFLLTLNYFDLFDYPLKKEELWQWWWQGEMERTRFEMVLDKMRQARLVGEKEGWYFLVGREEIVEKRKKRELISWRKIKKARRIARLLSLIPGLKMIAICSNLGYLNAEAGADIDLFIVSQSGWLWRTRFWAVALMKILGQRPSPRTIKDKICLSYFVSEDNLNLRKTALREPDVHLVYLLTQYWPLYSEDNLWGRFVTANSWVKEYLPNFNYNPELEAKIIKPSSRGFKKIRSGGRLAWTERWARAIQLKILPLILREAMGRSDKKVIINDGMLKLHSNDKREEINKKF